MPDTPSPDRLPVVRRATTATSSLPRRGFLAGVLGSVMLGVTACGGTSVASSSGASTSSSTAATTADEAVPTLESLVQQVTAGFTQATYADAVTGTSLPYNIFVPDSYDAAKTYPLVLYIADSSLVGQDVTAPLSQYGALIWASAAEQAEHESIVVVPEYPSVIIDDHDGHTTTDFVEMTPRLLASVQSRYSVDPQRVYGTGQSMGCMTVMYLAAQHPDLFAAELLVSGQWDTAALAALAKEKFFSIAAGGDPNASAGQTDLEAMLTQDGVAFQKATWDATWSAAQFSTAAAELLAPGDDINFATFATGTVLQVAGSATSGGPGGASEHMASFEPAYKITALRNWLFQQSA